MLKNYHGSMAMSVQYRSKFAAFTDEGPYEWKIIERDVKPQTNNPFEPQSQFLPDLPQTSFSHWWRGFKFVKIKGHALFQREMIEKLHCRHIKIYSKTLGPISTKLSTNHPWVDCDSIYFKERATVHSEKKRIQVHSNDGPI